ncbi:Asp23/Gls24 family envelope stress response protein [Streptomyces sp. NPDC048479]|uniref:Asp23/Gls24 family envelope stress response protein n=1 Tax=Streptomyces sp. NPDC048479 TaxID=3154725 RepID=UPI0034469867
MDTAITMSVREETGAAQRGSTTISNRTVERIAARALTEVEHIGGTAGRMLGVAVTGEQAERSARVTAKVSDGATAALDVRLSVVYPRSVAHTTEDARAHLQRRVADFTGLAVTRVDITVTALHTPGSPTRRVQ